MKFLSSWWFLLRIIFYASIHKNVCFNIVNLLKHTYSHDSVPQLLDLLNPTPIHNKLQGFCLQFIVYKPELHQEVISFWGKRNICQRLFWSIHRNNIPREYRNQCLQFQTRTLENNCSQVTSSTLKRATIIFRGNHRSTWGIYLTLNLCQQLQQSERFYSNTLGWTFPNCFSYSRRHVHRYNTFVGSQPLARNLII